MCIDHSFSYPSAGIPPYASTSTAWSRPLPLGKCHGNSRIEYDRVGHEVKRFFNFGAFSVYGNIYGMSGFSSGGCRTRNADRQDSRQYHAQKAGFAEAAARLELRRCQDRNQCMTVKGRTRHCALGAVQSGRRCGRVRAGYRLRYNLSGDACAYAWVTSLLCSRLLALIRLNYVFRFASNSVTPAVARTMTDN